MPNPSERSGGFFFVTSDLTLVRKALSPYFERKEDLMTKLSITSKGQVTLRKEVLKHLGLRPGDKVAVDLLPDGRATLSPVRSEQTFRDLSAILKGRTNGRVLSIDELNEAIASAAADVGAGSDPVK